MTGMCCLRPVCLLCGSEFIILIRSLLQLATVYQGERGSSTTAVLTFLMTYGPVEAF